MSYTEFKTVLRFRVASLEGCSQAEALAYFRQRLGEPEEVDEYDGKVEFFWYNRDAITVPVRSRTKQWGVEVFLSREDDNDRVRPCLFPGLSGGCGVALADIEAIRATLVNQGFDPADVAQAKLHSYSWYNGSDDPITFE